MAGSRIPGPIRIDPFYQSIPSRTPGSLGRNDAGDPNSSSQLGNTSGPLGLKDHAEPITSSTLDSIPSKLSEQSQELPDPALYPNKK